MNAARRPAPACPEAGHSTRRRLLAGGAAALLAASLGRPDPAAATGGRPPFDRAAGETPSGLPVPRFASLKFDVVNARAGPDTSYPLRWVYRRRGLPVRIVAETDNWRRIEDPEGSVSWVHKRVLDGRRTAIVRPRRGASAALRVRPAADGQVRAWLSAGLIVEIGEMRDGWQQAKAGGRNGWIAAAELWGARAAG